VGKPDRKERSMDIEVEFQSGIPLVDQIVQQLQILIEGGELAVGSQLPTTRQLAVQLGINFNTVARAYRLLDQEGLISTQPGRGTFVLGAQSKRARKKKKQDQIEDLARFVLRKGSSLGFEPQEIKDTFEKIAQEEG
jgi:GntR family transcriptional regulator